MALEYEYNTRTVLNTIICDDQAETTTSVTWKHRISIQNSQSIAPNQNKG